MRADVLASSLVQRFAGVWVLDTSIIPLPQALADQWPGSGKSEVQGRAAAIKLPTCLDVLRGALRGPLLGPGRPHDKLSPLQTELPPAGTLRLTDLGFYALHVLRSLSEAKVFWLCRAQVQTTVFTADERRWTLVELLKAQRGDMVDLPVTLGASERLPARLIAFRLDPPAAARRRRKVRYIAHRKAHPASPERLALCSWDVLVTNVPAETLTAQEARVLGRACWQIELLFKLWKSEGQLDASRSHKPYRILCELYAKLIAMVVQHWLLLTACWRYPDRSLVKATAAVRACAQALALALRRPARLQQVLTDLADPLRAGCRINRRRARPNTYQLLSDPVLSYEWCHAA